MARTAAAALCLVVGLGGVAAASESAPEAGAESAQPRPAAWAPPLVLRRGYEVGAEASLLHVGRGGPLGPGIDLGAVTLLRLRGRFAWGERTDVGAGLTLLAHQPSSAGLWIWQSASLSLRQRLSDAWSGEVLLDAGPQIPRLGHWGVITATATARQRVGDSLVFEGTAGADVVHLPYDDGNVAHIFELRAGAEARFAWSILAFNAGLLVAAPFASTGSMGNGIGAPTPRLLSDLHAGVELAVSKVWIPYVQAKVIRRGELRDPRTTVPLLDGGFDQEQVIVGVVARVGGI